MRRLAVLLPLWLACIIVEPGVLHSCPTHGGGAAAHGQERASHGHHAPHTPGAPQHRDAGCTCIGACNATQAFAPAASAVALAPALLLTETERPSLAARVPARESQYRLPWSNGPPRTAVTRRA